MGKPILVTGATGFLGQRLVAELRRVQPGVPLRLLCRGPSPWDSDSGLEVIRGDITSAADVQRAMEGAGGVYHLAGLVSRDPGQQTRLYATHLQGARNVCEAARRTAPEKIIFVSSSGTIAVSREPVEHDEASGYKHDIVGQWPYYLSKIFAEKLAFSCAREWGLPIVVVSPSLVLGPGDDRGSSTGDIDLFLEGQILAAPPGGLSFLDARDAAAGLIAAMRCGRAGERYLLGAENWTFRHLMEALAGITGVRAPRLRLPLAASLAGARLMRALYPLAGKTFRLDEATIRMSTLFWYCNTAKARAELGFQTRDPLETLRDTVEDIRRRRPPS